MRLGTVALHCSVHAVKALLTCGVTRLYHELFYHSVEDVSIVVALAGMHTEVLHRLRTAVNREREITSDSCEARNEERGTGIKRKKVDLERGRGEERETHGIAEDQV